MLQCLEDAVSVVTDSCVLPGAAKASFNNKGTGNRSLWLPVGGAGGNFDMAAECELLVTLWEDSICIYVCVCVCMYLC